MLSVGSSPISKKSCGNPPAGPDTTTTINGLKATCLTGSALFHVNNVSLPPKFQFELTLLSARSAGLKVGFVSSRGVFDGKVIPNLTIGGVLTIVADIAKLRFLILKNGKENGPFVMKTKHPVISFELSGNISVSLNLGKEPFRFPVSGFTGVTPEGRGDDLFNKYTDDGTALGTDALYKLSAACDFPDSEIVPFLFLAKIGGKTSVQKNSFVKFCDENSINSEKDLGALVQNWLANSRTAAGLTELLDTMFKFSNSLSGNEPRTPIPMSDALTLLKTIQSKWEHFNSFKTFLEELSNDPTTKMNYASFTYFPLLESTYHSSDDYDPSCPNLVDQFAEWQRDR